MENKKAIVLLSGGLDSTTVLAIATSNNYDVYCLSFKYGQRHTHEIDAATKIAKLYNVKKHLILNIELDKFGGSALTDNIDVPKLRDADKVKNEIPVTYVPARNTIFLSYALAWAEVLSISDIFIGVNAVDYSGYPDCREKYIAAFENMANLATKASVENKIKIKIQTPIIDLSKADIIKLGTKLGVDYSITHTCYDPTAEGLACGICDSCNFRKQGFIDAGINDPTNYS